MALATALLAPLCARAVEQEITFRGQKVYIDGASEVKWVGDPSAGDAELVIVYKNTDPNAVQTFRAAKNVTARVLAVGGGGAGGTVTKANSTKHPGGGGGGAGELVDRTGVPFAAETLYSFFIGAGGQPQGSDTNAQPGGNGQPSFIQANGVETLRVLGGGGGGGESVGQSGGSGGGGSNDGAAGGAGSNYEKDGKANGGGSSLKRFAGGGGGAAEAGEAGQSKAGGKGGDGVESDINPFDIRYYAAGGGGGNTSSNTGLGQGGNGGGGNGGGSGKSYPPTAAGENSGSGGGGGGLYTPGAAGGSGIIIIRLTDIERTKEWKAYPVTAGGYSAYIFVDTGADIRTDPATKDIIITYTDPFMGGGLSFAVTDDMTPEQKEKYKDNLPVWANARILAVGGGGGGGMMNVRGGARGGGAGGGAGGFVEQSGLVFDNQNPYSIAVGVGGKGADRNETAGKSGGNSSVTRAGTTVIDVAVGGGGGGATGAGEKGGSGGGSSAEAGPVAVVGGEGTSGQGFAGGTGAHAYAGGGGGGAGGAGGDTAAGVAGYGGSGKKSDITGTAQWYAGGGGGGYLNTSSDGYERYVGGAGGSGVGGNGAGNRVNGVGDPEPVPAGNGAANTGSGGGGGASFAGDIAADEKAGDGGHGVVIIRLSGFVVKAVPVPSSVNWNFDGNAKTGVVSFFAYTLTGPSVATNAGWYHVVAKIDPKYPFQWDDSKQGQGERTYDWKIAQMEVAVPTVKTSFVYNGTEQWAVDKMNYSIEGDYCYLTKGGNLHKYCHLEEYRGVNATNYTAVLSLVQEDAQGNFATNYIWKSPYTMEDQRREWEIKQAPNEVTAFSFADTLYKNMPHPNTTFRTTWGQSSAIYEYALLGGSETNFVAWGTKGPQLAGNYLVRATVPETANWKDATATLPFGLWMKLGDLYTDQMEITVSGCTAGTTVLTDFPVPVKLHEPKRNGYEQLTGFEYARAGATGKEMHFFDASGYPVEHEVDTWNIHGDSIVWVRVPKLTGTTTKLTLCWNRVGDIHIPEYDGGKVWKDYVGVWHMSQIERSRVPDATGHGYDAYFTAGSNKELELEGGPCGRSVYLKSGNLLADCNPYPEGTITNRYSFSGWYQYSDYEKDATWNWNDNPIKPGARIFAGTKYGVKTLTEMKETGGWCLRANESDTYFNWVSSGKTGAQAQDWAYNFGANWNIKTMWGFVGFRSGYEAPSVGNGLGFARYYATEKSSSINPSTVKTISYYVDGRGARNDPVLLAAGGFRVDEVRLSTNVFTQAWLEQTWRSVHNADYCTCGLVSRDCDKYNDGKGLVCDWWTTVPGLSKTIWKQGEAGATRSPAGAFKSGATVDYEYFAEPGRQSLGKTQPTAIGYYSIVNGHASSVRGNYWPISYALDFYIIEATKPERAIGGNGGDSGRILLMNADTRTVDGQDCSVTNQGWCATNPDPAAGVTWWEREDEFPGEGGILPGTNAVLRRSSDGARLWAYENARHGNTFPESDGATLPLDQVFLPASSATALSVTNEELKATRAMTGWLMLRNVEGAALYSPCYTNGIGTIYFDAVNSRKTTATEEHVNTNGYTFVVEIATETTEGLPPVDSNCWTEVAAGYTNFYGRLDGMWKPATMYPAHFTGAANPTDDAKTEELALKESTGGTVTRFYRVRVPIVEHRPIRFRLRRTRADTTALDATGRLREDDAFILLDNVLVSVPPVTAKLMPYGRFDESLDGRTAVGYGGAFAPAFPSWATDCASLTGRCSVVLPPNSGYESRDPGSYISMAQLFYRWRYLDQLQVPETEGAAWNMAVLKGAGALSMETEAPLALPGESGDVEFYLTAVMKSPYYQFVDYTASHPKVCAAGYTEESPLSVSRRTTDETKRLPSGGIDWYVRLRDGRSAYEGVRLIILNADGTAVTNRFELTGDRQWTARPLTRNLKKGTVSYRLEGINPQVDGSKDYPLSTVCWRAVSPIAQLPTTVDVATGSPGDWSTVVCDGATDYLLFQLDEKKMRLQVAHAEFQAFDRWASAMNADGLYVGSTVDTNSTSAVAAEYNPQWDEWRGSVATNANWQEDFSVSAGEIAEQTWYPHNKPFLQAKSRNSWLASNAMWVYGKWTLQKNNTITLSYGDDSAVQLEGRGKGMLELSSASSMPDGIDQVNFTARIAQYNDFNDFTYFNGYRLLRDPFGAITGVQPALAMTNTTFVTFAALTEKGASSYDGDGSLSLVNYYHPQYGCYELRASRGSSAQDLRLTLYKWYNANGTMKCRALGNTRYDWLGKTAANANMKACDHLIKDVRTPLAGLFLSAMEGVDSKGNPHTHVVAGIAETDISTSSDPGAFSGQKFNVIVYNDQPTAASGEPRLTQGTFGVLTANCPGVFVKPACYLGAVSDYMTDAVNGVRTHNGVAVTFVGDRLADGDVKATGNWIVRTGRIAPLANHSGYPGFQAADVALTQQIAVEVRNRELAGSPWEGTIWTNTVSGFCDVHFADRLRDPRSLDVRLRVMGSTDDVRTDVVINDVQLTQWNGQWTPNWDNGGTLYHYLSDKYVYTSAWVTEDAAGERGVLLQPTRAKRTAAGDLLPVSIRSAFMRGLGLVHFKWRNADPHAKLLVQVKENVSSLNIKEATSTLGEGGTDGWETFGEPIEFGNRDHGEMTVHLNRRYHDEKRQNLNCLVRLVIDPEVEAMAISDGRAIDDPAYGQVEITEMYTWDLPEYDEHSWVGWNFRASGWDGSRADSFANLTDGMRGLSAILNNTLDETTLASREKSHYRTRPPNVQSPVFRTNCIAAVQFKARLYDEEDYVRHGYGAVVTIYGTRQLDEKGEPKDGTWEAATDVVVTNRTYAPFLVKLKANDGYLAVRLGVKGVAGVQDPGKPVYDPPLRVAIDDICLWERSTSAIAFRGAKVRPFRDAEAIKGTGAVLDIEDVSEQPLASESFGFQGELVIQDEEEIIMDDPAYPITVDLWYYAPQDAEGVPADWGFDNWKTNPAAVCVQLVPATGTNLVFRSTVDVSKSLCPPQFLREGEPYRLVQYHLVAHYYYQDHQEGTHDLLREEWTVPEWYSGFPDPNATRKFSAFTLLERLAPRRAWINEVNFCEPTIQATRANQWIELAIPSGEDMTGWKLDVYDYEGNLVSNLGTFGELGWKTSKTYSGNNEIAAKSHYAFYTVKSPYTVMAEGLYDGKWRSFNGNGVLEYNRPYAFALTRPTGIVEHRVVVQGKNEAKGKYWYWGRYEGTNLVEVMHRERGGTWTWADEDYLESPNCTVGVITNQGALHVEWKSPLAPTVSDINIGQYIDPNWLIRPNGGYVWIYSNVIGEHLRQVIGSVTNVAGSLTVQEGTSTNIQYIADRWYKLDTCEVTPPERTELVGPVAGRDGERIWTLNLNLVSNRIDVLAKEGVADEVQAFGATPDNPYTPAIMEWLRRGVVGGPDGKGVAFKNPGGPLVPMIHRGTDGSRHDEIKFPDLYWFDIDPTEGNWELWGGMGGKPNTPAAGTLPVNELVRHSRVLEDGTTFVHTNHVTSCWIQYTNVASSVSYAPYRLQGLGNEQSDSFPGAWTSATFKVTMALNNGKADYVFQPLRYFVFDFGSFGGPDDPVSPFGAVVEITDPFSKQSPAAEWGWRKYEGLRENSTMTKFAIDGRITPTGVTTLKKRDLLDF